MSDFDIKYTGSIKYARLVREKNHRKYDRIDYSGRSFYFVDGKVNIDIPPTYKMNVCHKRERTDSPPPKKNRHKKGFNRGKAGWCQFCRPEITIRCYRTSVIRKETREFNKIKNINEYEDLYFTNEYHSYDDGYETS
jgi:hypothetical protein